jgi:hypothetical protein
VTKEYKIEQLGANTNIRNIIKNDVKRRKAIIDKVRQKTQL